MRSVVGLVVFAVMASGCSLFGAADADEGIHWLTKQECAGLSLGTDGAEPLMPIPVDGWPEPHDGVDHGIVVARILTVQGADTEEDAPVVLVSERDGAIAVPAPVHPVGGVDGGDVQVRIGQLDDGEDERWCGQTHALRVEPLAAAGPGQGLVAQLDATDAALDEVLAEHGTTARELAQQDHSSLPGELIVLYLVAALLHHPDGLYATIADLTGDEQDIGDRLMAQIQQLHATELPTADSEVAYRVAPASSDVGIDPSVRAASVPRPTTAPLSDPRFQLVRSGTGCTETDFPGIAELLGKQLSGDAMVSGASGAALGAARVVGGLPVIGRVGLPMVLTAWTAQFTAEYLKDTLPSTLQGTEFIYGPDVLLEDDVDGGEFERISMRFTSNGFDPGPLLAELAVITVAGPLWSYGLTDRIRRLAPRITERGASLLSELVVSNLQLIVGSLIDDSGFAAGHTALVKPSCWEATTEAPELLWTHFDYLDAIKRGPADYRYVAAMWGPGTIDANWSLPIGQSIMGVGLSDRVRNAQASFGTTVGVDVEQLKITWDSRRRHVKASELVELYLQVDGAHDARVRVTDSLGLLDQEVDASNGTAIRYRVPADWDPKDPIEIVATSLAATGLRHPDHPAYRGRITANAWLTGDEVTIRIEPGRRCVNPGGLVTFRAIDDLLDEAVPATWSADWGVIDADGHFTAPPGDGRATITATHKRSTATAIVTVRDPCNVIQGTYNGLFEGTFESDRVAMLPQHPPANGRWTIVGGDGWPEFLIFLPPIPGQTGSFGDDMEARTSILFGDGRGESSLSVLLNNLSTSWVGWQRMNHFMMQQPGERLITITITHNTTSVNTDYVDDVGPGLIEGTLTGSFRMIDPDDMAGGGWLDHDDPDIVHTDVSFTIHYDPDQKDDLPDD